MTEPAALPLVASATPGARAFLRAHRTLVWWTVASFVLTAWIPVFNHSKYADLSDWYNDHLHHPFATWVALHKGTEIYSRPFAEIWDGSGYPQELKVWGEMPMAYPPGVFVVFLPSMLIGRYVPMSQHAWAVFNELYMMVLGHLAFFAVLLALSVLQRGSRAVVGLFAWMVILSLSLNGFFDPVFVGAGALTVYFLAKQRPGPALSWLAVGALLHFRMAAFAPLGLAALWQLYEQRKTQPLPWKTLAFVAVAAAICVWTFLLMYPATAAFRATHPPVLTGFSRTMVIVYSLAAAGACLYLADVWVALCVCVCLLLSLVEIQPYAWHAAITLAPLLAVGGAKAGRQASIGRAVLLGWALALGPLVWNDSLVTLFFQFARHSKL